MYKLVIICFLFILSSCNIYKGYVKFDDNTQDEIIFTKAIKDHLKENPNTSIVLKAPNSPDKITESNLELGIFSAVEKELLIAGFDVKDRGLFNEVVSKSDEIDYSEIKKITGTNLILELVQLDVKRKYETNSFYSVKGNEIVEPGLKIVKYGGVVEFKITIIEGNQHGGSYLFYYSPCSEKTTSCNCEVVYKDFPQTVYLNKSFCNDPSTYTKGYVSTPSDNIMIEFVRAGVRELIKEIKE
jgi:hypothetical protein